ncbi:protein-L-isoaspartate(D-aspartate) O-methyltransferase [soil metagenome]
MPPPDSPDRSAFGELREAMVDKQLRDRGIDDERVLAAMAQVPRERYVPKEVRHRAYDDSALPLSHHQTISQPWVVAAICQGLELAGNEDVLEIGTGSGYSAAVLSLLAKRVWSVERIPELAGAAGAVLADARLDNVEVVVGDGSRGLPEHAPYGGIAVHAATPDTPLSLLDQLADGGRLSAPVAAGSSEVLMAFARSGEVLHRRPLGPVRFVPLIGEEGFDA